MNKKPLSQILSDAADILEADNYRRFATGGWAKHTNWRDEAPGVKCYCAEGAICAAAGIRIPYGQSPGAMAPGRRRDEALKLVRDSNSALSKASCKSRARRWAQRVIQLGTDFMAINDNSEDPGLVVESLRRAAKVA